MTTTNLSPNVPAPDHPSSTVSHDVERLPPEILGEIVKVSALSSLRQASILARVCNAFHSWCGPLVIIGDAGDCLSRVIGLDLSSFEQHFTSPIVAGP